MTTIKSKLEDYRDRITTEYDEEFHKVKDLKWDPWVGVDYHKHRILIMGKSTYYKNDSNLGWKKDCDTRRDPSRSLIVENWHDKPFRNTAQMFIEGAGKEYSPATSDLFWNSVAFNNHCQQIVEHLSDTCGNIDQANSAFKATLAILKPKLCLVWTTKLWDVGFKDSEYQDRERVGRSFPRVAKIPPTVGVSHPSRAFSRTDWLNFLLNDDVSKGPTSAFIEYLHNHSTK